MCRASDINNGSASAGSDASTTDASTAAIVPGGLTTSLDGDTNVAAAAVATLVVSPLRGAPALASRMRVAKDDNNDACISGLLMASAARACAGSSGREGPAPAPPLPPPRSAAAGVYSTREGP